MSLNVMVSKQGQSEFWERFFEGGKNDIVITFITIVPESFSPCVIIVVDRTSLDFYVILVVTVTTL